MYTGELARQYPLIDLDPSVLYVGDGQVFTSAGTAAAIDLSLHLVRLDYGAEVANVIARRMVVPAHRDGGQAQFVESPLPEVDVQRRPRRRARLGRRPSRPAPHRQRPRRAGQAVAPHVRPAFP